MNEQSSRVSLRQAVFTALPLFIMQQVVEAIYVFSNGSRHTDLCSWDCGWYVQVAVEGYDKAATNPELPGQANWAFFPGFPLLIRLVHQATTLPAETAALLLGKALFFTAIVAFIVFASLYTVKIDALALGTVAALSPFALYGNNGYSEPLFLLLTSLVFMGLRERRWGLVAIAGACLSGVRVVGSVAVASYLVQWLAVSRARLRIPLWPAFIMPTGLVAFAAFLWWHVGDPLAFVHVQSAWGREFQNPLQLLWWGLHDHPVRAYWAAMGILGLAVGGYFLWRREWALGVFTVLATLLPLMTGLWALPRYVAWQAPVLLFFARFLRTRLAVACFVVVGVLGQWVLYVLWLQHGTAVI